MKPLKKILGINLAILLAYSILIRIANSNEGSGKSLGILVMSAFVVGIHVIISLIVAGTTYKRENKELSRAWILNTGIVLLVGFSTCLGNASF